MAMGEEAGGLNPRQWREGAPAHLREYAAKLRGDWQSGLRNGGHRLSCADGASSIRDGVATDTGREHGSGEGAAQWHTGDDHAVA